MKNALLLHCTNGDSQSNWLPWLHQKLEKIGYTVWTPNLPQADKPNIQRYNQHILNNKDFEFNNETIIIGHSSGAVAILGLLQSLPAANKVKACYLIGSFKNDLGWDALSELFVEPLDFQQIKKRSRFWYFIHSDNDPHCPLEHAKYLHTQIGGDLIVLPGQQHFSISTAGETYKEFLYLYHLIVGDAVSESDVLDVYESMEARGVTVWLDGGWGVDALLEKQTRPHGDIDVVIQKKDESQLREYLEQQGFTEVLRGDSSPQNYMLGNTKAQFVDIHVIELDEQGNGIYGPKANGIIYEVGALSGTGNIAGKTVKCISPEWVVKFHSGYELRECDFHDVLAVCEKFQIEVPEEYRNSNYHSH